LVATSSQPGLISNLFVGIDRRLCPIAYALLYAVLAFWLLSADWVLGPVLLGARLLHSGLVASVSDHQGGYGHQ